LSILLPKALKSRINVRVFKKQFVKLIGRFGVNRLFIVLLLQVKVLKLFDHQVIEVVSGLFIFTLVGENPVQHWLVSEGISWDGELATLCVLNTV